MNREIKFRAWYSNNGVKDEMVYFPEMAWMCTNGNIAIEAISDKFQRHEVGGSGIEIWWRNMSPLMQFTGLKDKNGKEIYEGDIVKWGGEGMLWADQPKIKVIEDIRILFGNVSEFEIIGNIYENPNLLTNNQ